MNGRLVLKLFHLLNSDFIMQHTATNSVLGIRFLFTKGLSEIVHNIKMNGPKRTVLLFSVREKKINLLV